MFGCAVQAQQLVLQAPPPQLAAGPRVLAAPVPAAARLSHLRSSGRCCADIMCHDPQRSLGGQGQAALCTTGELNQAA